PLIPLLLYAPTLAPLVSAVSLHDALPISLGIGTAAALVAAATPGAASPLRLAAAALVSIATIGFLAWDRAARTVARLVGSVAQLDRKSTRLNSSHEWISYAVFCLKQKDFC